MDIKKPNREARTPSPNVPLITNEFMSGQSFNEPKNVKAEKIEKLDPDSPPIRKKLGIKKLSKTIN